MNTLQRGSMGQEVIVLQNNLKTLGLFTPSACGTFGPITQASVMAFQKKYWLKQDGAAGPKTLEAINCVLIITRVATLQGVDVGLCLAVASCESGLNSQSVLHNTDKYRSIDRGLFQLNSYWYHNISDADAYNAEKSTNYFCNLVKKGHLIDWKWSLKCWIKKVDPEAVLKYITQAEIDQFS